MYIFIFHFLYIHILTFTLGYQITIADFERAKVMDEELDPEELEKVSGGA